MPGIESPVNLGKALGETEDRPLHTIAAYLVSRAAFLLAPEERANRALPPEDMETLGFRLPQRQLLETGFSINVLDLPAPPEADASELAMENRGEYYATLADLIARAEEEPSVSTIAAVVRFGLSAPDALVRVCALSSAIQIFIPQQLEYRSRMIYFWSRLNNMSELAVDVFLTLDQRWSEPELLPSDVGPPPVPPPPRPSGLILVHGTHLWWAPDPYWHLPKSEMHTYVSGHRQDTYGDSDPYEWEGRWTDRGRRVAAQSLVNWIGNHDMNGCDVIAHSHGCNVVMKAAELGADFGKAFFCSCPVHWSKYNLYPGRISQAHSVRVKFDMVVYADGGDQKFPAGAVTSDTKLKYFFGGHSDSRTPDAWEDHQLYNRL